jgi:hypothetical protein
MALPFLALAIPVLHSSGAWIATSAASGYIAGTLSCTWIGAFVLGNSALLSGVGLVSAAGLFGASGGLTTLASGAVAGIGSGLAALGLGSAAVTAASAPATALALPTATFLGFSPIGWAIAGTTVALTSGLTYLVTRATMLRLNEERQKGGLPPITLIQIVREVRLLESESLQSILARLNRDGLVALSADKSEVAVNGRVFSLSRLKYVINPDGSEEIVFITRTGRTVRVLLVKGGPNSGEQPA